MGNPVNWHLCHPFLSPKLKGFVRNEGTDYVPFKVVDKGGKDIEAKYICVHMTSTPYAIGIVMLSIT